jgi:hypothetical protein
MTMKTIGLSAAGHPVGEYVYNAKLTFKKAEELRRLRIEHGWSFKALGEHFGINPATAHKVVSGRAWVSPVGLVKGVATQADVELIRPLVEQGHGYASIGKIINATGWSVLRVMKANGMEGKSLPIENSAKTHCKHGHPFLGDNLFVRSDGARGCMKCRQIADQRSKIKKRDAQNRGSE